MLASLNALININVMYFGASRWLFSDLKQLVLKVSCVLPHTIFCYEIVPRSEINMITYALVTSGEVLNQK